MNWQGIPVWVWFLVAVVPVLVLLKLVGVDIETN
jgi:hypothetical protein